MLRIYEHKQLDSEFFKRDPISSFLSFEMFNHK